MRRGKKEEGGGVSRRGTKTDELSMKDGIKRGGLLSKQPNTRLKLWVPRGLGLQAQQHARTHTRTHATRTHARLILSQPVLKLDLKAMKWYGNTWCAPLNTDKIPPKKKKKTNSSDIHK